VVGTDAVTFQIEVKGFRRPIIAKENGSWLAKTSQGTFENDGAPRFSD
jgi:hypothetical protein